MHNAPTHNAETRPGAHPSADVKLRPLVWFTVIFILVAVGTHAGLYYLFFFYERQEQATDAQSVRSGLAPTPTPVPAIPLQGIPGRSTTEQEDMANLRREESVRLGTYGPGEQPGFVRIPIGRAMELVVQRQQLPFGPMPQKGAGTDEAR